ncbi:alpha/beta hydrolase [Sphingobacterium sp. LRF_L2]|uniref:alpha/beta hydrolase n=1 Tax=Sphingobacterium sp. LRF_L2 TaxID=3369421 RepID=UPI003F6210FA
MTPTFNIQHAGLPLSATTKVLIMLHGRGGNAQDILSLAPHLQVADYTLLAPQAIHNTWYPYSFLAAVEQNEPSLSTALATVLATVDTAIQAGVKHENIYFFGFSQGACLTLEFLARNAQRYGGAVAIIGGLIGETIDTSNYQGDFGKTPIFLGTSNPDFHVPLSRVQDTATILQQMNAQVTERVFENFGHGIHPEEIKLANDLIFN